MRSRHHYSSRKRASKYTNIIDKTNILLTHCPKDRYTNIIDKTNILLTHCPKDKDDMGSKCRQSNNV
jgi:hypothetical protein